MILSFCRYVLAEEVAGSISVILMNSENVQWLLRSVAGAL